MSALSATLLMQPFLSQPTEESSTQQIITSHVAPFQDDLGRCSLPLQQTALLPLPHTLLKANTFYHMRTVTTSILVAIMFHEHGASILHPTHTARVSDKSASNLRTVRCRNALRRKFKN
jgi:hypothetical protein